MINCKDIWIKEGSKDGQVKNSQIRLQANGFYLNQPRDGRCGPVMAAAIGGAQKKYGLDQDKIIGPKTCTVLNTNPKCPDNNLRWGCVGNNVKVLQTFLNKYKFGSLVVDGEFLDATEVALKIFQKAVGIDPDGKCGPVTVGEIASYKPSVVAQAWTRIIYIRDSQDWNYTCGPSSLKMALSVYGLSYTETYLKGLVGAKEKIGTSNEGIVNAVNNLGKGLKAWNESFKSWETLRGYLAKGWPVILRIASYWTEGNEHYVLLSGLNIKDGKVELGDPSNGGFRATTTADLLARIKKVGVPSVIVISR